MAKGKGTAFFCKECGYESVKWLGQCPACREWNTFVEEPVGKKEAPGKRGLGIQALSQGGQYERGKVRPSRLSEITIDEQDRMKTGFGE